METRRFNAYSWPPHSCLCRFYPSPHHREQFFFCQSSSWYFCNAKLEDRESNQARDAWRKRERRFAFWVSPGFFLVENPGNEQSRNETIKKKLNFKLISVRKSLRWRQEEEDRRARKGQCQGIWGDFRKTLERIRSMKEVWKRDGIFKSIVMDYWTDLPNSSWQKHIK